MLEGIPRLDILNERIAFSVQSRNWKLLQRTLIVLERTKWEEQLKPHVATILTNGCAALSDIIDGIGWSAEAAAAASVARKIERIGDSYWRKPRTRRALRRIATELRQAWRPWEAP